MGFWWVPSLPKALKNLYILNAPQVSSSKINEKSWVFEGFQACRRPWKTNIFWMILPCAAGLVKQNRWKTTGFWRVASLPKALKNLYIVNDSTMRRRSPLEKSMKNHGFLKGGEPSESLEKPIHFEWFYHGPQASSQFDQKVSTLAHFLQFVWILPHFWTKSHAGALV